ncbi:MAG: cyclase family protein [Candidatus Hydrogenedentota bacterium]
MVGESGVNSAYHWVDVSMPLFEGMTGWPENPPFEMSAISRISDGDMANVSNLAMTTHTGTHIDAPYHFCSTGARVHELEPELFFGPAGVLEIKTDDPMIRPVDLGNENLPSRLLLKTRNAAFAGDTAFHPDFSGLTSEAAARIVAEGVQLVGIDYLSIAPVGEGCEATHRILLEAGVVVVEGLDLREVPTGTWEFVVLPLAIQNGDGAPCRAFVGMEAKDG